MQRHFPLPGRIAGLAVGLAIAAGLLSYWEGRQVLPNGEPLEAISRAKSDFVRAHHPEFELDLNTLAQNRFGAELVQPEMSLPRSHLYPMAPLAALFRYAEDCADRPRQRSVPGDLQKTWLWHRFLCGDLANLPALFFETSPYMHPSGNSFVRLAELSGRPEFGEASWRAIHKSLAHVVEVERGLSRERLKEILKESPLVLGSTHVLLRQRKEGKFESGSKYVGYPLALWANFLRQAGLETAILKSGQWCLLREGNSCWKLGAPRPLPFRRISFFLWLVSLALLTVTLLVLIVQKLRLGRKDREARLFALQTLTHELRTPATTLTLGIESLKRQFDRLPAAAQSDVLRMSDEIQRLGRVLGASTQYVKSHRDPRHIGFSFVETDSINDYFRGVLEPYLDRVGFTPLTIDSCHRIDRYWLAVCVKNLVENALVHGKSPVHVKLTLARRGLLVEVSDAGSVSHFDLEDLKGGHSRKSSSPGLGIGLSIVARVASLMKGRLTLGKSPTTFSLWLRSPA